MPIEMSRAIDQIAQAQHGLVTSEQATTALGLSRKNRWVKEGRLLSVQPRVLRVAGAPPTWHQAVLAASLAADGTVSHRSAAELWGLIQPAGYVEISVRRTHSSQLRPPAIVHRIKDLHPELATQRQGLRLTDPVRTVIDLGLVLPKWAVADALSRGITTRLLTVPDVERLRDALGRQGRNGTGVMRSILEDRLLAADQEESLLEARFAKLVSRANLPLPEFQHEVWHAGRFIARIDAAYPDVLLAIEVDGFSAHTSPGSFQRDRTRQNRLVALGWTVLRFTWADVVKDPASVARTIRVALDNLSAA